MDFSTDYENLAQEIIRAGISAKLHNKDFETWIVSTHDSRTIHVYKTESNLYEAITWQHDESPDCLIVYDEPLTDVAMAVKKYCEKKQINWSIMK